MLLALDVGNTNIVLGCLDGENTFFEGRISTDTNKTEAEFAVILKNLLDIYNIDLNSIDGAIISSVVPQLTNVLKNAVHTVTGCKPIEVNININHGLTIAADDPAQVGNDLIVAAAAALEEYTPPIILFDLGTATTITLLDENSVFRGVAILPGIKTALNALVKDTSQLPAISLETPKSVIGKNTVDAMKSGLIYGNTAMIDGMIERISKELNTPPTIVATGGLAKFFIPHSKYNIIYDESLLLKGLFILYTKNKEQFN